MSDGSWLVGERDSEIDTKFKIRLEEGELKNSQASDALAQKKGSPARLYIFDEAGRDKFSEFPPEDRKYLVLELLVPQDGSTTFRWRGIGELIDSVWVTSRIRLLVGADDIQNSSPLESSIRFAGRLFLPNGSPAIDRLIVADTERATPVQVSDLRHSYCGSRRVAGAPSAMLRELGIENDAGWQRQRIDIRFEPLVGRQSCCSLWMEHRIERTGPLVELPHFRLPVLTGDWLSLVQRLPANWPPKEPKDGPVQLHDVIRWVIELTYSEPRNRKKEEKVLPSPGTCRVLEAWNRQVADRQAMALRLVRAGEAMTFVPHLEESSKTYCSAWIQLCVITDFSPNLAIVSPKPGERKAANRLSYSPPTLQLVSNVDVKGKYSGLKTLGGKEPEISGKLSPRNTLFHASGLQFDQMCRAPDMESEEQQGKFTFDAYLSPIASPENPMVFRIGALDLSLGQLPLQGQEPLNQAGITPFRSRLEAAYLNDRDLPARGAEFSALRLNATIVVPLSDITPGSQDELPDQRTAPTGFGFRIGPVVEDEPRIEARFTLENPLVIPIDRSAPPVNSPAIELPPYALRATEVVTLTYNRTLSLTLTEVSAGHSNDNNQVRIAQAQRGSRVQRLAILDRTPLLIAAVEVPAFKGSSVSSSSDVLEIGNWITSDLDGPHWEIRGLSGAFDMILPPQAVGEAMERFKIDEKEEAKHDINPGELVDYRFSPASRLGLNASVVLKRFAEPPWNLRRILGYPGQRTPGADVTRLQFEFLYGLSTDVTFPGLKLTEIIARLGQAMGRLEFMPQWSPRDDSHPLIPYYRAYRKRWARLHGQFLSRLSVLEAYSGVQVGLLLERDVAYRLRRDADLRYPIPGSEPPSSSNAPNNSAGLAGGVSWGFESVGAYEELWRNPNSVDGKLANPYFSAMGGWGYQKAVFAEGKQVIHSNTAMGRVFYYSLERIGRIGVLWNTAKHVIVYERSVVPSAQFVENGSRPDGASTERDDQDLHLGRPVLRKVSEYVELLEPHRAYPESAAAPITRGFVAASDFKTRIIPVNSKRLRDLVDESKPTTDSRRYVGYTIPLWDPQDQAEKPTVYPKPQIVLECISADGADQTVNLEIDDPQKLVFYTNASEGSGSVPSLWPPVRDVDFQDLPLPTAPFTPALDPSLPEQQAPDAPQIDAGYHRFTWNVVPPKRLVNLVAERADNAIKDAADAVMGSVIRNVTMVRAKANKIEADEAKHAGALVDAVKQASDSVSDFLQKISRYDPQTTVTAVNGELQPLAKQLDFPTDLKSRFDQAMKDGFITNAIPNPVDVAKKLCDLFNASITEAMNSGALRAQAAVESIRSQALAEIDRLRDGTHVAGSRIWQMVNHASGELVAALHWVSSLAGRVQSVLSLPIQEINNLRIAVEKAFDDFEKGVDDAVKSSRIAQLIVDYRNRLMSLLEDCETAVRQFNGLLPGVASPLKDLIDLLTNEFGKIDTAVAIGPDALKTAIKAAKKQISDQMKTLTAGAENVEAVGQPLGDFRKLCKEFEENTVPETLKTLYDLLKDQALVTNCQAAIKTYCDDLLQRIGKAKTDLNKALSALETTVCDKLRKLASKLDLPDQLKNAVGDVATKVKKFIDDSAGKPIGALRGLVADMHREIGKFADQAFTQINKAAAGVANTAQGIFQAGDSVVRLVRAFGDSPIVQGMDFSRDKIAYYFNEAAKHVDMTPVTAFADRVARDATGIATEALDRIRALRIRVPTRQILDRCIPDALKNFDLASILPSLGGLELTNLFSQLKMPDLSGDAVKVTHGFDREALRAWLRADTVVRFDDAQTLFSFGPVSVRLNRAIFEAHASVSASASGAVEKTATGAITGDWVVIVGEFEVITFTNTSLKFEDGKLHYNISPERMKLSAVLKFISDVIEKFASDNGFSLTPIAPSGLRATLMLPFPDLVSGTTGISGLLLAAGFEVRIRPQFSLGVSFGLSKSVAPFNLSIFILGGSGFIEIGARYTPSTRKITVYVSVGIFASAQLAFALGPIKGLVYIGAGIKVDFSAELGGPSTLALSAHLLIRGEVDCAGLISVSICIELIFQYEVGNGQRKLLARGTLSIRVKICWCFTFSFSASVEYSFANGSEGQKSAMGPNAPLRRSALSSAAPGNQAAFLAMAGDSDNDSQPSTREDYNDGAREFVNMTE